MNRSLVLRLIFSALAMFLAHVASAAEVSAIWVVNYTDNISAASSGDWVGGGDGGGSSASGSISVGNPTAAGIFRLDYPAPQPSPPGYATYTEWSGLAGGNIAFGHIIGGVGTSLETSRGLASTSASFYAQWSDVLDVTPLDGTPAGTQATLLASILVEVNPSSSNSAPIPAGSSASGGAMFANSSWTLGQIYAPTNEYFTWQRSHESDGSVCYFINQGTPDCGTQTSFSYLATISVPFIVGSPVPLDLFFSAQAESLSYAGAIVPFDVTGLPWQASASLGFFNTVAWQGVTAVLDENGQPISFALASESGTDWSQPITAVPAPGVGWLVGVALGILGGRAVRRKSRRQLLMGISGQPSAP